MICYMCKIIIWYFVIANLYSFCFATKKVKLFYILPTKWLSFGVFFLNELYLYTFFCVTCLLNCCLTTLLCVVVRVRVFSPLKLSSLTNWNIVYCCCCNSKTKTDVLASQLCIIKTKRRGTGNCVCCVFISIYNASSVVTCLFRFRSINSRWTYRVLAKYITI